MKELILKSVIVITFLFVTSCSSDDNKKTRILPTQIEIEYPTTSASYQTLDITYNSQFQIERVTRNRTSNTTIYSCSYNDDRLTNLKIEEPSFDEERNYQMEYTNGILSKIIAITPAGTSEYNIDHNSVTNTYKYNFPYTWKFDSSNDLEFYYFSSTIAFEVTYQSGNAFNYFMNPQPVLAILDSYFAENFYQDLFFLSQKPISMTRYEDLISSDVIEQHYTNTFDANNRLISSEIRYGSDVNPSIIKTVTYSEVSK